MRLPRCGPLSFGPVDRDPSTGTFASAISPDDPWDVIPISCRRSQKQRIVAHATAQGLKVAEWGRRAFEAAIAAEEDSTSDCTSTKATGR